MNQRADARLARAFILSTRRPTNAQTGFLPCCHIGGWPARVLVIWKQQGEISNLNPTAERA